MERMVGYPAGGLSYPNGSYSKEILQPLSRMEIEYARTGVVTGRFNIPESFLIWNAACRYSQAILARGQEIIALHKHKTQYLYIDVCLGI